MPLSFSVIKERELRRILSEIETYLGKAGKEYAKDTCRDGKYNPELADLAKYHGHGWQNEVALKNHHTKALRVYRAQSLEELDVDVDTEYRIVRDALESDGLHPEEEILSFYRKYSELGVCNASYVAGVLEFAGFGCEPDPDGAFVHFMKSKGMQDDRFRDSWLDFFAHEPEDRGQEASFYEDYPRFGYVATKDYDCPLDFFQPEWFVLQTLCADTPRELIDCDPWEAETANELFEIHQYRWYEDDATPDSELPNFAFKPLGFEVSWYKDQKAMSMNLPLKTEQLGHVLRLCIQYIIDNKCWRGGH